MWIDDKSEYEVVWKAYESSLDNSDGDTQIVCDITWELPPMGKTKKLKKIFLYPNKSKSGANKYVVSVRKKDLGK